MQKSQSKGLKSIPSQVQLPGGVVLKGIPFKIVEFNPDGTPKLFALHPIDQPFDIKDPGACVLFAQEQVVRGTWRDGKFIPK
jgi:hypothetical protein